MLAQCAKLDERRWQHAPLPIPCGHATTWSVLVIFLLLLLLLLLLLVLLRLRLLLLLLLLLPVLLFLLPFIPAPRVSRWNISGCSSHVSSLSP